MLLLLFQIGRLQPVGSTGEDGGEARPKEEVSFKPSDQISFLFFSTQHFFLSVMKNLI